MSQLILLRHGESEWNKLNQFTGWQDSDLSERGEAEAAAAGNLLNSHGLLPEAVFTSVLTRAIRTTNLALDAAGCSWVPTQRSWRLNERHYGALEGLNKAQTRDKYGDEQFAIWRRSYSTAPPALALDDDRHPCHDPRYGSLAPDVLPATECLADVISRLLPYWYDAIIPALVSAGTVLVVAHGNSLRALVKHLDGLSEAEVVELNIPTGQPLVYELDSVFRPLSGRYLDPSAAAAAAEAVKNQGR